MSHYKPSQYDLLSNVHVSSNAEDGSADTKLFSPKPRPDGLQHDASNKRRRINTHGEEDGGEQYQDEHIDLSTTETVGTTAVVSPTGESMASVASYAKCVTAVASTAGSTPTLASKVPSHHTNKIWTHFHQIITNSQEPLVQWSSDGKSIIISDWKQFSKRKLYKQMFGYSQAVVFNRAFDRVSFQREKIKMGKTTMFRFTHPNFVRDDPGLVCHILSSRGTSVEKYNSDFKPCTCKGCQLRGEDGKNRVWYADWLCETCQEIFVSGMDGEKISTRANILLENHLNKILQRNDYKQTYYDQVALWWKQVQVAKVDGNLNLFYQLAQESPSVRRRLQLVADLKQRGESTDTLDPLFVLSQHPELVACCVTDGCLQKGIFRIEVTPSSANIARAAADDVQKLRSERAGAPILCTIGVATHRW